MRKQFFGFFLWMMTANIAAAQSNAPAKKVFIDLNTGFSIENNNTFTNTWDPLPAIHLNIRLPFYIGKFEGGARYIRYDGFAPSQTDSDFSSVYMYLGYGVSFKISSWYRIEPVIRFGNNLMIFDEAEHYVNNAGTEQFTTDRNESEFALELVLRNQFQITNHLYLNTELSYNHTFTFHPLPVTLFSVGISYSFWEPNWLKTFIQ